MKYFRRVFYREYRFLTEYVNLKQFLLTLNICLLGYGFNLAFLQTFLGRLKLNAPYNAMDQ